jgi:hypothetical protein
MVRTPIIVAKAKEVRKWVWIHQLNLICFVNHSLMVFWTVPNGKNA